MSWQQRGALLPAGLAAAIGQIFITKAYSKSPAKEISVYDYSIVLFTALLGFLFLSEVPDWMSVVGYCVIIFAAVGNWYMTLRRDRKARGQSAADGAAGNAAGSAAVNGQAENAEDAAAHAPPEEGEPPEGSFEGNESGKR